MTHVSWQCATCRFFRPPAELPAHLAGHVLAPPGVCHRFPQPIVKPPGGRCGEHQSLGERCSRNESETVKHG